MAPVFIGIHLLLSLVCLAVAVRLHADSRSITRFCLSVWFSRCLDLFSSGG